MFDQFLRKKEDEFDKFITSFHLNEIFLEELGQYSKKEIKRKKDYEKNKDKIIAEQKRENAKLLQLQERAAKEGIHYSVSPATISQKDEYKTLFWGPKGDYDIKILPKAYKKYKKYSDDLKDRFFKRLKKISVNPISNDIKKIRGKNFDLLRARVGDYRILFQKVDELRTIFILLIAHRQESYNTL